MEISKILRFHKKMGQLVTLYFVSMSRSQIITHSFIHLSLCLDKKEIRIINFTCPNLSTTTTTIIIINAFNCFNYN
jgi:hypothetical protein